MEIHTPRLLLRTPVPEDAPAMLEIRNSPHVLRYNPMTHWSLPRMEKQVQEDARSDRAFYIVEKATSSLIGGIWLEPDELRYGPSSFTLSYYLARHAAGKGYMTEALSPVLSYAFVNLGAEVLSARVFTPNSGSARVLQKLGFSHEGTLRRAVTTPDGTTFDDMLFSLLREEAKG